jgi:hypothetical protein
VEQDYKAEPGGQLPAVAEDIPTKADWRALCTELVNELDASNGFLNSDGEWVIPEPVDTLVTRARAALAQPEPEAVGEAAELVEWLYKSSREWRDLGQYDEGAKCHRAAEFLARYARPAIQPVPVSERLPGAEDCDAEGRCWLCGNVEGDWRLMDPANTGVPQLKYCFSHWLPAHALPLHTSQEVLSDEP